jgi:hypothetical protein
MEKITKNKNGQWDIEKVELNLDKEIEENKKGPVIEPDFPSSVKDKKEEENLDRKKKMAKQPMFGQKMVPALNKKEEDMEKGIKSTLAAAGLAAAGLASNTARADVDPHADLHSKLSSMNIMGEYHVGGKSGSVIKEPGKFKASPEHPSSTFNIEHTDKNKIATGNFFGPDAEKAKAALHNFYNTHINKTPNMMVKSELEEKLEQLEEELLVLKKAVIRGAPLVTGTPVHTEIGKTKTNKPIMSTHGDSTSQYHDSFTPEDHREARIAHGVAARKIRPGMPGSDALIQHHNMMADFHDKKGVFNN